MARGHVGNVLCRVGVFAVVATLGHKSVEHKRRLGVRESIGILELAEVDLSRDLGFAWRRRFGSRGARMARHGES